MAETLTVVKYGNSAAVVIPAPIARLKNIQIGDKLRMADTGPNSISLYKE